MAPRKKYRNADELENLRLVQQAEDKHDIKFEWKIDVDPRAEFDSAEERANAHQKEYFYCVATAPDGRRASLSAIEDPAPDDKTRVEADLARELGIEPDWLPPEVEDMHTMDRYDESIGEKPLGRAEWDRLMPGDNVYYKKRDTGETFAWRVVDREREDLRLKTTTKEGKPMTGTFSFESGGKEGGWYPEALPEEEMHTMTGYDEARLPASRFLEPLKELETAYPDYVSLYTNPTTAIFKAMSRDGLSNFKLEAYARRAEPEIWTVFRLQFNRLRPPRMGSRTLQYEFYRVLKEEEELPDSLEEVIKTGTFGLGSPGRGVRTGAIKDLKRTPELVEIYGRLARVLNRVPEEEEMHTLTGYDEATEEAIATITDKGGKTYPVHHRLDFSGRHEYTVDDGYERVASATLRKDKTAISSVKVWPDYQRRGVASALYDFIEQDQGIKLAANPYTTEEGEAFWKARRGEAESVHVVTGDDEALLRRLTRLLVDANPRNY